MTSQYAKVCKELDDQRQAEDNKPLSDPDTSVHPPEHVLDRLKRLRAEIAARYPEPEPADPQQERNEP